MTTLWMTGLIGLALGAQVLHAADETSMTDADGATRLAHDLQARPAAAGAVGPSMFGLAPGSQRGLSCTTLLSVNGPADGDAPRDVVFLTDGSAAAIANRDSNNVSFLDIGTQTILDTTPVGEFPVHIAATPDGRYLLTANVNSDSVSVIDVATRSTIAEIPITGEEPYRVEITDDSAFAVVGVINPGTDSSFSIIDLGTLAEIRSFPSGVQGVYGFFFNSVFPVFGNIFGSFAVTPDSRIVLPASDTPTGNVFIYDLLGNEIADLSVPSGGFNVDISADGSLAVVPCTGASQSLVVIDLVTNTVDDVIATASNIDAPVAFSPDASTIVASSANDTLLIDRATGVESARISTGTVGEYAITVDNQYVMVSNFTSRLIDLDTESVVAQMPFAPTADLATSPVGPRAVGLNNRFGERVHLYATDGSAGQFLAALDAGPSPEGDAPFDVDVSADGTVAVVGNTLSANVAVIDTTTRTVRAWIPTGERVSDVAVTPDGTAAISADGDSDRISVIDLTTDAVVAQLPTGSRPSRVLISPDGTRAFVLSVAGADRLWFVNLDGASSTVYGSASVGQTGSWNGAQYSETSGIAVSPDGTRVAVCDSFNDQIRIYDTDTASQIAVLPAGDFPIRCAFTNDGQRIYATNAFSDDVSVLEFDGASWSNIATITGFSDAMLTVTPDPLDDNWIYVTDVNGTNGSRLYVLFAQTNQIFQTISLGGGVVRDAEASGGVLYLMSNASGAAPAEVVRVGLNGPFSSVLDRAPASGNSRDIAYAPSIDTVLAVQPFLDAVDLICFTEAECGADYNADGAADFFDVQAFLDDFAAMEPMADLTGDGVFDFFDVQQFLNLFAAGCP